MSVLTDMGFSEVVGHATEHYPFRVSESVKKTDDWFSGEAKALDFSKCDVIPRMVDLQLFDMWLSDIGVPIYPYYLLAGVFDWHKILKVRADKFLSFMRSIEGASGTEFEHQLWSGAPALPDDIEMVDYYGVGETSRPSDAISAEWWDRGWYLYVADGTVDHSIENLEFGPTRKDDMTDRAWKFSEDYYTRAVKAVKESMIGDNPTYFRVPFTASVLSSYCSDGFISPPHAYLKYFFKGGKFSDCKWGATEDESLKIKAEPPKVKLMDIMFPYILSDSIVRYPKSVSLEYCGPLVSQPRHSIISTDRGASFEPDGTPWDPIGPVSRYYYGPKIHHSFNKHGISGGEVAYFKTIEYFSDVLDGDIYKLTGEVRQEYSGEISDIENGIHTIAEYLNSWSSVYGSYPVSNLIGLSCDGLFSYPVDKNLAVLTFLVVVNVYYSSGLVFGYDKSNDDGSSSLIVGSGTGGECLYKSFFSEFNNRIWVDQKPCSPLIRYDEYTKLFSFQVPHNISISDLVSRVIGGPREPCIKYVGHRDDYLTNPPIATDLADLSSQVEGATAGSGKILNQSYHLTRTFNLYLLGIDGVTSDSRFDRAKMPVGTYKYNWRNYTNE